jgi:uncharacterized membrane protein
LYFEGNSEEKIMEKMIEKRSTGFQERPRFKQAVILAVIFFSVILLLSLHRYYSFFATYDQGLFNQLFWNSVRGQWFQSSLSSSISGASLIDGAVPEAFYNHLGQHFVIDFLLWLPLYALFPTNVTLIVLQVVLITAAGLVLYALARQYLSPSLSVMITASYYGAIAIIAPTLSNFYELCQIPLLMFSLFLALEQRRWWLFWLMVALVLGVREEAGIILFGVGFYLILSRRHVRTGLLLCLVSFSYVVFVTNVIMPLFSRDNSKLYLAIYFKQFVHSNSPTTLEVLWGILTHPKELLLSLLTPFPDRLGYFLGQCLPLAWIPALSGAAWAIVSFPLIPILLQQNDAALNLNVRYAWTIAPGLFYGAILWWHQHPRFFQRRFQRFWIGCIIASMLLVIPLSNNFAFYFLLPDSTHPWRFYTPLVGQWQHAAVVQSMLQSIPPDASVSATTFLIPELSNRRNVVRLPEIQLKTAQGVTKVDYVIADLSVMKPKHKAFILRSRYKATIPAIATALRKGYGIVKMSDRTLLLQKGAVSDPQALSDWLKLRETLRPIWKAKEKQKEQDANFLF